MGRVSTATEVLVVTPQALSIAVGALLVTLIDYRLIFAMMSTGTALAAVYLLVMLRGRLVARTPPVAVQPLTAEPS